MPLDLSAYLDRIGYDGPREPTPEVLRAIHVRHPQTIPFESIDPWLGRPVALEIDAIQNKLVTRRRGGYCYEHNTLLWQALAALGFRVQGLSARVLYSTPPGGGRHPRNHMLMLIGTPDGEHIADVGFGGLTLTAPMRLETGIEQSTPHERVRLTDAKGDYVLEVKAGDVWRQMYQFGLTENIAPDYEMANYYMSTHPRSPFVARLVAARPLPDRRLALADRSYTIYWRNGEIEKRELASPAEVKAVLETDFDLALPADAVLDAKLAGLFPRGH